LTNKFVSDALRGCITASPAGPAHFENSKITLKSVHWSNRFALLQIDVFFGIFTIAYQMCGELTLLPLSGFHVLRSFQMVRLLSVLAVGVALVAFCSPARADDKEVKLEGKILCAKCELGVSPKCAAAIVVEKDSKKTTYWFDETSSKKYHGDICQEVKPGTVTGTVKKDGDKMIVTVTTLKYTN
jgi:hypothetical protein